MFNLKNTNSDLEGKLQALDRSQAIIEFNLDGTILTANTNFLNALGYTLDEIKGKHHSMFVDPAEANSAEYRNFWAALNRGEFQAAEYKRIGKGGREIWIQATYNPILDKNGKAVKVVKFAADVTARKMHDADIEAQLAAIHKSQAVIEFQLDGTILTANANFLNTLGYTLDEIKGKHHSMFVEPAYRSSPEYASFWAALRRGEYQAAQYKRIGKGGKEVWIEASYNPIFDLGGRPVKVVKFATDISKQIHLFANVQKLIDENLGAIDRSISVTSEQATSAASAATQTTVNVQAVAGGSEQLEASVREISQSMNESKAAVDSVFDQTEAADGSTKKLTEAASAMGGIIEMIKNIAGQINLLALNATIESARAGEAGRGFAVVASEVKNLAKQAADATEQIEREIGGMRAVSDLVVQALHSIKQSVSSVREYITGTASAVEEQSIVAREMSSNMQEASTAVSGISVNVEQIVRSIAEVTEAMSKTKEAARTLASR
jgi:methyl-accepting chemotaxis protein